MMKYLQLKTCKPIILSRPVPCQPTSWERPCRHVIWYRKCCVAIYSQLFLFCLVETKKLRVWNRNLYLSPTVISAVNEGYELGDEIFCVVLRQKPTYKVCEKIICAC